MPHNVEIKSTRTGTVVFNGDIVNGPATKNYCVPRPARRAPTRSICTVHPNMTGTLTVK